MNKQGEILQDAVRHFNALTGANLQVAQGSELENKRLFVQNNPIDNGIDGELIMHMGAVHAHFYIQVKNEMRQIHLPDLVTQMTYVNKDRLLVCRYIPKPVKEELRRQGINYLEAGGNCFIRKETLYFFINDQPVTPLRQPKEGKLWKSAGLKFIFVILQNPALLNSSYRMLAATANIALGNIGHFIDELKVKGFLEETKAAGKTVLQLKQKEVLLQRWVELFAVILKPKLLVGRFRFINDAAANNWKKAATDNYYWGGEPAAAILTKFLKPELFTIYAKNGKTAIMKALKLAPDENGVVELVEIFWNHELLQQGVKNEKTVSPLLVYADLVGSLDSRNHEAAQRIKKQYLD